MNEEQQNQRVAVVKDYFRKLDSGDSSMMDLLTDDIQIYFPKFGVGYGKAEVARAAQGMMSTL